ncbi:hypothetical protein GBAR_LOCUS12358 [Geodia barretti]|uniref:Uncharacterized protein n=1 Tax=Geodia barretti TaxID=519541 RepID=A0AA35RZT1_GEOBA|nr:hypothetical protein GBAR_LOCUS12358 [Geodia barretti]
MEFWQCTTTTTGFRAILCLEYSLKFVYMMS